MSTVPAPIVEPVTYGHGSFGIRCQVCDQDDYQGGIIRHLPGCAEVTKLVRELREKGRKDETAA